MPAPRVSAPAELATAVAVGVVGHYRSLLERGVVAVSAVVHGL